MRSKYYCPKCNKNHFFDTKIGMEHLDTRNAWIYQGYGYGYHVDDIRNKLSKEELIELEKIPGATEIRTDVLGKKSLGITSKGYKVLDSMHSELEEKFPVREKEVKFIIKTRR